MKRFENQEKQEKIQAAIRDKKRVSYRVLQELERDRILEDYDLFHIISNQYSDMFMFYMNGEYYVIDRNRTDFRQIERNLLQTRCYVIQPNRIQEFIKRNGKKAFLRLSTQDLLQTMLGIEIEEER